MPDITILIPADVDTQNAKDVHSELASQMKSLTENADVTLGCDAETPSILAEQLGFACASALSKSGHRVSLDAPWDTTFKLDTTKEQGAPDHG